MAATDQRNMERRLRQMLAAKESNRDGTWPGNISISQEKGVLKSCPSSYMDALGREGSVLATARGSMG